MRRWLFGAGAIVVLAGALHGFAADESGIYRNKTNGFSIWFPSSWKIKEGTGGMAVRAVGPAQDTKAGSVRPTMSISVETVPLTMTIDEYAPRGFEKARKMMPDLKVSRMGRQSVSQTRARWWTVSFREGSATMKGFLLFAVKEGRAFRITAAAPLDQYSSHQELLGKIVKSFEID